MIHVYSGICDKGNSRDINQDAIIMKSTGEVGIFAVADGMGGHSRGEFASQTIVCNLEGWWTDISRDLDNYSFEYCVKSLREAINEANNEIYTSTNNNEVCGSTLVLLFLYKEYYCVLNAGDSRLYELRQGKIKQLTMDDTWENQPDIRLSTVKKRKHPFWGKLVNAIGISENVGLTLKTDLLSEGFLFVLCSDGIYKYGSVFWFRRYIRKISNTGINSAIKKIVGDVSKRGSKDNISLIIVADEMSFKR